MAEKEKERYEEIPLDAVEFAAGSLRSLCKPQKMEELRSSIKAKGVLVPVVVREEEKVFVVIAGTRRVMAARAAGLTHIPAIIVSRDAEWATWATVAENRLREPVNAIDEGRYCAEKMEQMGLNQKELAEVLHVSESWVQQRLRILGWPDEVKAGLVQGQIEFAVGRELAGIKDEASRQVAVHQAVVSGCTARQAVEWRKAATEQTGMQEQLGVNGAFVVPEEVPESSAKVCDFCGQDLSGEGYEVLTVCKVCLRVVRNALAANPQS